jgi:ABC-type anion transport system duplicated permease subunit
MIELMSEDYEKLQKRANQNRLFVKLSLVAVLVILLLVLASLWGCPQYRVWSAYMDGEAQLARAENEKLVAVTEAQANVEAERLNAEAEVARAEGAARAIEIEAGKISDSYIKYLWVRKLSLADSNIIYLPTEGGLPVLTQPAQNNEPVVVIDGDDK